MTYLLITFLVATASLLMFDWIKSTVIEAVNPQTFFRKKSTWSLFGLAINVTLITMLVGNL